jgi:hypothetical protein
MELSDWNIPRVTPKSKPAKDGRDGKDAREIELQSNGDSVQWRYIGDDNWIELLRLNDIRGRDGEEGRPGRDAIENRPMSKIQKEIYIDDVDGGCADSTYLNNIEGGRADSIYSIRHNLGGGNAE